MPLGVKGSNGVTLVKAFPFTGYITGRSVRNFRVRGNCCSLVVNPGTRVPITTSEPHFAADRVALEVLFGTASYGLQLRRSCPLHMQPSYCWL